MEIIDLKLTIPDAEYQILLSLTPFPSPKRGQNYFKTRTNREQTALLFILVALFVAIHQNTADLYR